MQNTDFMLFAEYFQFYVQDGETDDTLPVHWEPEDEDAMVLVTDRVISVRTVRELDVPITFEQLDAKPEEEELDDWDHVIESTLQIESGNLLMTAASEDVYEAQRIPVEPGAYGIRIYFGMLDRVDSEGFEGEDNYRVCIWKIGKDDEPPPFSILKQWTPERRY